MRSPDEIKAEIADPERKAAKRRNKPGFNANVIEIDARLAQLRDELGEAGNG
jgi:hypothetical protein